MLTIPSRVIATSFALISFASALFVGTAAGNPLGTVLLRGLFVMVVCYVVGLIVGGVAQHVIDRHVDHYKNDHPIPDPYADEPPAQQGGGGVSVDDGLKQAA